MTCSSCSSNVEKFGASPINAKWCIVRGDTGNMRVKFFEVDEVTIYDTDSWTYKASAYDTKTSTIYDLDTVVGVGYIDIIAYPSITELWGIGFGPSVAELSFDVQVTIPGDIEDTVWTPVIGSISVIGDVSLGSLI